jgi:hypothetical protein
MAVKAEDVQQEYALSERCHGKPDSRGSMQCAQGNWSVRQTEGGGGCGHGSSFQMV